jgi:hypothetical protein
MINLMSQYFTCPTHSRPLLAIVPDGIEIKCRFCKQTHFIGRSFLEQAWNDLLAADRDAHCDTRPLHIVRT